MKNTPVGGPCLTKSPLSPFRYSEDSLRIRVSDIEANNARIPFNLPVNNSNLTRTPPAQSRPQTPRLLSKRNSLPSSPFIHSPLTRTHSSPINIPSYQTSHGLSQASGGGSLGTPAHSIRDYDESQREIKKENFNLKLRIFFLEERLALGQEHSSDNLLASNIDLKVQLEASKNELSEKLSLLMEASEALELLDARMNNENMDVNRNNKGPEEKGHELKRVEKKCQFTQMSRCQNYLEESTSDDAMEKECLSTELMVQEVLEELEEFSEREKDFENKYNKEIKHLKEASMKTEADLEKIQMKLAEYEDEIESLNANLDAKNEFITALQDNMKEKNEEAVYLENQLEKSSEVIKEQEKEINSIKGRLQAEIKKIVKAKKPSKSTGMNTETNDFINIIQHLEDEILFKNQEINEFQLQIQDLEEKIESFTYDQEVKQTENRGRLIRKIELMESDNKKMDDQLKLQIQERKLLLKKISMLKEQLGHQKEDIEKLSDKKEIKDVAQQCNLDKSLTTEVYKENLSRFRETTLTLKNRLAKSIESLREFHKNQEKFVHMVEVIVEMNDINIRDEIINLLNESKQISKIPNEAVQAEDLDFFDPMSISSCSSSSSESCESIDHELDNCDMNILEYVKKEKDKQRKILKRNSSIIFQLEDELLIGDALTYGQMKIINDLKNNLGKLQNKEDIENGENSNNETWNNADCCGLPLSYLQHSSGPKNCEDSQELECLDEKCLAREKNVLIDLLERLREEISSCEIIESDVRFDHEVKDLFNICENCSACIQEDMHEMLKNLHYILPHVLDQVKKLKKLCETSRTALSESKKLERMVEDYHVLITQLTSENLKLTGEKLANKAEIEEMKKKNTEISIREGLKDKTTPGEECFLTECLRGENINNSSSLSSSDSTELINSWSPTQPSHCHGMRRRTSRTRNRSDDSNPSEDDWSSDSQDEESYRGVRMSRNQNTGKIPFNKEVKKLKTIRKHQRFPRRFSDS